MLSLVHPTEVSYLFTVGRIGRLGEPKNLSGEYDAAPPMIPADHSFMEGAWHLVAYSIA